MKRLSLDVLLVLAAAVLLLPRDAYAYLDPGSGSMALQLLLGGLAGLYILARMYLRRILVRLGLRKAPAGAAQSATGNSNPSEAGGAGEQLHD